MRTCAIFGLRNEDRKLERGQPEAFENRRGDRQEGWITVFSRPRQLQLALKLIF